MELRLIDPNGYTVPDGIRTNIDPTQRPLIETQLRTQVAAIDLLTNGHTPDGRTRPEYRLDAYRVQATPDAECAGCYRDNTSTLRAWWVPTGKTCALHQITPAEAVADRIREAIPYPYGDTARITVTIDPREGGITVQFTATRLPSMDAAEDLWATLAEACGIPPKWARLLVSPEDNEIKARVRHGFVDPGMASEYRRGVPVRLVAHGWTAMKEQDAERQEEFGKWLAALPLRTVPAQGSLPGYTVLPITEGAVLPDGATVTAVEDPLGSDWIVTVDSGEKRHIHKHVELRRYTTGRLDLVEPEWAGMASD
ncbi:hypothetical protein TPA0910_87100 [Streptomyces hygroscopicus subsp. sporocinereus]|uniref:Uncharacterized protein n=1 Tax=Streptomyces hygroscopicus TaxID=1912 RepID=A0ABQ3UFA5_STRHY|nr:hypothetical protein [Streptomyces hygroscopicus]GHJ34277.1 hypothetical protein TPA0910_87100 [Streptomyces hygroscopicus]